LWEETTSDPVHYLPQPIGNQNCSQIELDSVM
jgi:hypothetical protein